MALGFGATVIFDDLGRTWRVGDPALGRWLGNTMARGFAPEDLVRNLGFVLLQVKKSALEVKLRPLSVAQKALAAALYEIHDRRPVRLILTTDDRAVRHDMFTTVQAFREFVIDLICQAHRKTDNRFFTRSVSLDQLESASPLHAMYRLWDQGQSGSAASRRRVRAAIVDLANRQMDGRVWIMATKPTNAKTLVDDLGPGFRVPNPSAFRHLIGNAVSDHPDVEYGRWLAQSFQQARRENRACIEDVDCMIHWHDAGPRRHRYRRIVFPFQQSDGTCALVGATLTDISFDLRREPLREVS